MFSCNIWQVTLAVFVSLLLTGASADNSVDPAHPRRCYSCDGVNCLRTSMTEESSNCTDMLDICVTIFEEFAVVAKGCYLEMPERHRRKCDQGKNPECFKCFGELCNNLGRADFKCIECNSKENSKCANDTSGMVPVQCSVPTASNSYCYVKRSGNNLQRGCLTHVKDQLDCVQDAGCSMCLSQDAEACNSYQLRTSPAKASASGAAVLGLGIAVVALTLLVSFN